MIAALFYPVVILAGIGFYFLVSPRHKKDFWRLMVMIVIAMGLAGFLYQSYQLGYFAPPCCLD